MTKSLLNTTGPDLSRKNCLILLFKTLLADLSVSAQVPITSSISNQQGRQWAQVAGHHAQEQQDDHQTQDQPLQHQASNSVTLFLHHQVLFAQLHDPRAQLSEKVFTFTMFSHRTSSSSNINTSITSSIWSMTSMEGGFPLTNAPLTQHY